MPAVELSTPRLHLAPITDADVAALVRHWGDEQVRRYLWDDQPVTLDMVSMVVTTSNRDFRNSGYGVWALRATVAGVEPGVVLGMCGLRQLQENDWVEILFSLRPRYWQRGFATEAAREVLRHAFETCGLERVVAGVDIGNLASIGVLKRLGMTHFADDKRNGKQREYWSTTKAQFSSVAGGTANNAAALHP